MRRSYKFKLYSNKKKAKRLREELFIFCQIYNHSLALVKRHYKLFGKNPSKNSLQKHLQKLMKRGLRPKWKSLGFSQGIQEVTDRIYLAYQGFFDGSKKGKQKTDGKRRAPPKFKPFRKYKSFTLKQASWKIEEDKGRIKIGKTWYRYSKSRDIQGTPKTITIKRDRVGDWFCAISCEIKEELIPEKIAPMTGKSAGFDFGLKSFLTSSDGMKYYSNEYLKSHLKEIRKKSKNLSKKEKGSKNRNKAKKRLSRLHRKIANKRQDAHFKLANSLIMQYDYLFFEDLNLQGMQKLWGRKISDYGFSDFLRILDSKAQEHKKVIGKIDRYFPSSRQCMRCGEVKEKNELKLRDRIFECSCGHRMDRDLNAAINILWEGASSQGLDRVMPDFSQVSIVGSLRIP